jgi:hypothetical protein
MAKNKNVLAMHDGDPGNANPMAHDGAPIRSERQDCHPLFIREVSIMARSLELISTFLPSTL